MTHSIRHIQLGIDINLSEDDLGNPGMPGLWKLLRSDKRPVPERGLQCMECMEERPHCPEWMYVYERAGVRIAAHHNSKIRHVSGPESDEHKALKERIAVAGERGGYPVQMEDASTKRSRRTDVTVHGAGGRNIGWEIQLSTITEGTVRNRSAIARADGLTPSWVTSAKGLSELLRSAPWALTNYKPWREIKAGEPIRVAGGVRHLEMIPCWRLAAACPSGRKGRCNDHHGEWNLDTNISLDDLVTGTAAGTYVQVLMPMSRWINRFWARREERDLYDYSVGGLPTEEDVERGRARIVRPSAVTPKELDRMCRYGQDTGVRSGPRFVLDKGQPLAAPSLTIPAQRTCAPPLVGPVRRGICSAGTVPCGVQGARLYPGGWFCDAHRPGHDRG
ncbi:hypothetical protein [Streptomyces sp. CBMA123]|uniref:competence protein CoiA family protein n=1 Tax=Streptomyces sp. CBMA123 TaxID=1896313 RepID=UPI001661A24E|nr:hypothetical protein [Streptomyces sp. CBMA123]MBD0693017.1 hypothetical protein [Streptomyces sp. CBMA123]